MSAQAPHNRIWLHGPAADLLLGCGGAYLLLLLPLAAFGGEIRALQPLVFFPLITLLVGAPHYGATLLRVYEHRHDRKAYAIFSVWATLLVAALFTTSLWVSSLAIFLVTLYLTWSPWHYTGQNYGIAVMLLRRAGVEIDSTDKRWIYASFLLSFGIVLLIAHRSAGNALDIPVYSASQTIHFQPIGIPTAFTDVAIPMLLVAYIMAIAVAGLRLSRRARLRELLPFALLSSSQVFWFVLPLGLDWAGWQPAVEVFRGDSRTHYFVWIAMAHSTQYLWVTSYYARSKSNWNGQLTWYAKVLGAGAAIWMLPALLLGPLSIGPLSMDQGLAILIAAAVNLHHFILDGAIWKLRGPIADVLLRSQKETATAAPRAPGLRRFVWAICAMTLVVYGIQIQSEASVAQSRQVTDVQNALDRLSWFGLDAARARIRLGTLLLSAGRPTLAREQFERSLELTPLAHAWVGLGHSYLEEGQPTEALEAFRQAREGAPNNPSLHRGEGEAWMQLNEAQRAFEAMQRAAELAPEDKAIARRLHEMSDARREAKPAR